jgi:hypothetical protein
MKKEDPMEKHINPDHTALRLLTKDDRAPGGEKLARAELYAAFYPEWPGRVYLSLQAGTGELRFYISAGDLRRFAELFTAAAELIEENGKAPAASEPESEEAPRA